MIAPQKRFVWKLLLNFCIKHQWYWPVRKSYVGWSLLVGCSSEVGQEQGVIVSCRILIHLHKSPSPTLMKCSMARPDWPTDNFQQLNYHLSALLAMDNWTWTLSAARPRVHKVNWWPHNINTKKYNWWSSHLEEETEADPLIVTDIPPLLWINCLVCNCQCYFFQHIIIESSKKDLCISV